MHCLNKQSKYCKELSGDQMPKKRRKDLQSCERLPGSPGGVSSTKTLYSASSPHSLMPCLLTDQNFANNF